MTSNTSARGSRLAAVDRPESALTWWAVGTVVLFGASLLVSIMADSTLYVSPDADVSVIQQHFTDAAVASRWVSLLQTASGFFLAAFTGSLWSLLRRLAPEPSASASVVALGGTMASAFLILNALLQWSLTQHTVAVDGALVSAFSSLFFGLGGFVNVAAMGLLVGGASVVALRAAVGPRLVAMTGLVIAVLSLASLLTMVAASATFLIPIGRFAGLVWIVATPPMFIRAAAARRELDRRGA